MNCTELQRVLPEIIDGSRSAEQEAHLRSCSECSGVISDLHLIAREARTLQASEEPNPRVWNSIEHTLQQWERELNLIAEQARNLQASEEPSPRVWNSIEIALRQEGLIRQPQREPALVRSPVRTSRRWGLAWMVPVAAALVFGFGVLISQHQTDRSQLAERPGFKTRVVQDLQPVVSPANANEDQMLLASVGTRSQSMRAAYEADLQNVNAYIQDAATSVASDPNDEEARESLMDAYEQRAAVYEMAMDRSLP